MKKRKNPLRKRVIREIIGDWSKYVVVSLFLILTIGFVSGMYVANGSMMKAADEGVSTYKRENGHFELWKKADSETIQNIESADEDVCVNVYPNFFKNEKEDYDRDNKKDGTIRVYAKTEKVNLASVMSGRLPQKYDEIAIDRMHADNVGIKVGDEINVGDEEYKVTGLIAYVNYSTLHEKSTDMMFDALKFNVGMVTDQGFDRLNERVHYTYAWNYVKTPKDVKEEKKSSDDFLENLAVQAVKHGNRLEDYVPGYADPAVNFATEDIESDKAMGGVLLDILIVICAFIFAVTISNTIIKESSAIGTLRASGYTRKELVCHYLSMPVMVTFLAAVIGNVLGYTLFKKIVVAMYYNSYSLPAYETVWNMEAFLKTTIVPLMLMLVVNLFMIVKMMYHTPLQFLRHDLAKKKKKKALRIPRWRFLNRFRLRIILQNLSNYAILFIGILFIAVMLAMAVGMPETLDFYKGNAKDMMLAKYQYVLRSYENEQGQPIYTADKTAEKFGLYSLQKKSEKITEEVSVYGVSEESRYVKLNKLASLGNNEVYISKTYADKYNIGIGDKISLDEKYKDKTYHFTVSGIYEKCQNIAVFMAMKNYHTVFETKEDEFSGYFSDDKITDIDEKNIATVITKRDITKMCDQLDHSMGSTMSYFEVLCILLSAVLMYLLTKIIIEKNENAISMTKVLGYKNGEIAGLYLLSTSIVVVVADAVSVILGTIIMRQAWRVIMFSYSGWYEFTMNPIGYVKMFLFILVGYFVVMFFDFRRIKKIPMDQALKNIE